MNVETTAEIIDKMAMTMRDAANNLDNIAMKMRGGNDITYASEAMVVVSNLQNNLRVDLLVTRPIRELQYQIERLTP